MILVLAALCTGIELALQAGDAGLFGSPRLRMLAYEYGAFWTGLFHNWRPNYPAQPYAMFVTYAFLHGGIGHLAGNMLTLVVLGRPMVAAYGQRGFLALYALSAVGGGIGFALLSMDEAPMVGASGAIFGLAGAIVAGNLTVRRRQGAPLRPVVNTLLLLVALNVVLWFALDGLLAWQTHLGGFATGFAFAAAAETLRRRKRPR